MLRLVMSIVLVLSAQSAVALSCMKHSVDQLYARTANAKEPYLPAVGAFQFDAKVLPKQDLTTNGKAYQFTATFEGRAYNGRVFQTAIEKKFVLVV